MIIQKGLTKMYIFVCVFLAFFCSFLPHISTLFERSLIIYFSVQHKIALSDCLYVQQEPGILKLFVRVWSLICVLIISLLLLHPVICCFLFRLLFISLLRYFHDSLIIFIKIPLKPLCKSSFKAVYFIVTAMFTVYTICQSLDDLVGVSSVYVKFS